MSTKAACVINAGFGKRIPAGMLPQGAFSCIAQVCYNADGVVAYLSVPMRLVAEVQDGLFLSHPDWLGAPAGCRADNIRGVTMFVRKASLAAFLLGAHGGQVEEHYEDEEGDDDDVGLDETVDFAPPFHTWSETADEDEESGWMAKRLVLSVRTRQARVMQLVVSEVAKDNDDGDFDTLDAATLFNEVLSSPELPWVSTAM